MVFRLQEIWRRPAEERPSIGVVTFNLKQAELIEQEMELLAEQDDAFRRAWIEERGPHTQNGEDMGFFVKNLENVQGMKGTGSCSPRPPAATMRACSVATLACWGSMAVSAV